MADWRPPQSSQPPLITVNSDGGGSFPRNMREEDLPSAGGSPMTSRNLLPQSPSTSPYGLASPSVYNAPGLSQSSEMLLPPTPALNARSHHGSDTPPLYSWGRTSVDSTESRDYLRASFASPFDDSRTASRVGGEDSLNTQTVVQKFSIMPTPDLILFPEDVEADDYLHNPDPNEPDKDGCNVWTKRGMMNVGGLIFITLGVLALFVAYPVITFTRKLSAEKEGPCGTNTNCLSGDVALLKNQRTSLIDPDTPDSEKSRVSNDGTTLELVFSDEFNDDGRTFYDGDDPFFQGVNIWYGVTEDIEWYDPDAISTANGTLNIKLEAFQNHNLNYRSGMLQSWNKLCFKGGRLEASISLPGTGDVEGFWPGFWVMGNLGRPGYAATTDGMWPYSYENKCDAGITANQSSPDGLSMLPGMRLPACTCSGEDHPTPGISRSAPEVDVIEASVGYLGPGQFGGGVGSASQSFQVAPFDIFYSPDYDYVEVYDNEVTGINSYRGGPYQEAFSAISWLNTDWYDGKAYQKYGIEYVPGAEGDLSWFIGEDYTWKIDHRSLRPNGNIGQRVMPQEPMSIVMNFGISNSFAQVYLANLAKQLPATMRVDYIRIYQDPSQESVTCDPEGYETTEYIKQHPEAYENPNMTLWEDAGYEKPTNTLINDCTS